MAESSIRTTSRDQTNLGSHHQEPTGGADETTTQSAGEERETVRRALAGDSTALETLFARDRARLDRIALSLLRNREDAEDALQDGLLSAYANLRSFEGRSRFSTWLIRIVVNAALMKRRHRRLGPEVNPCESDANEADLGGLVVADTRPGPEEVCAFVEAKNLMETEMYRLSPLQHSAFRLRYIDGLSDLEAAEAANVSVNTLKSRARRARLHMTKLLAARRLNMCGSYFRENAARRGLQRAPRRNRDIKLFAGAACGEKVLSFKSGEPLRPNELTSALERSNAPLHSQFVLRKLLRPFVHAGACGRDD